MMSCIRIKYRVSAKQIGTSGERVLRSVWSSSFVARDGKPIVSRVSD